MDTPTKDVFAEAVRAELQAVRDFVHELLSTISAGTQTVTEVASALAVERSMAWKLIKIASTADVMTVPQYLPGSRAILRVLSIAERAGVSPERVDIARVALRRYQELSAEHASDSASMELLVGSQASLGRTAMDHAQRRAAFRAASYMLGVDAGMFYDATFLSPSVNPLTLDLASVRVLADLTGLRAGVAWPIGRSLTTLQTDGTVSWTGEPLAESTTADGVPILPEFSSPDLPPLVKLERDGQAALFAVRSRRLGKGGRITVAVGEIYRSVTEARPTSAMPNAAMVVLVRTPCRRGVIDVFVHRPTLGTVKPTLRGISTIFGLPIASEVQFGGGLEVPINDPIVALGQADRAPAVRGIARHRDLTNFAAQRLGVPLGDFDVYRVELTFPPTPVALVFSFPLPDGANDRKG